MKRAEAYWPLILLMALIKFVFPIFVQSGDYELHRDEYLYYEQGQHLALGYLENPPILSWMARISSFFGGSVAWIKFWPSLFGAGTVVLAGLLAAEFGGERFAQFLAGLAIITGAYMRVHFLFQPNFLDIFFWTLTIYFLVRYVNSSEPRFILAIALSLALGWWSKYSILFMFAALIIGLLLTYHRSIFTKKKTWIAVVIAVLLVLPNVLWQYQHNWPLIHHMNELRETQLKFENPVDFIKDQLLMLFPVVFIWITGLGWLFKNPVFRIIGIIWLAIMVLMIAGSGKSYYALGIYPVLLAAGAVAIEKWSLHRKFIRYAVVIVVLVLSYGILPILLPVWSPEKQAVFYKENAIGKTASLEWEDQQKHSLPQDFADMLGWKELTERTENIYNTLPDSSKANTVIVCGNYGQAGALKYYSNDKNFRNRIFSNSGSFILWLPENITLKNLILVTDELPEAVHPVFMNFEQISIVDSVRNNLSRQFGDKILYCSNLSEKGLSNMREGLRAQRDKFKRVDNR